MRARVGIRYHRLFLVLADDTHERRRLARLVAVRAARPVNVALGHNRISRDKLDVSVHTASDACYSA